MLATLGGIGWTVFSAVRSNKYAMYAVAAVVFVVVLMIVKSRYDKSLKREGAIAAATAAAASIIKSTERHREINAEIKRLPLSKRAARLRATDRAPG